MTRNHLKPQNNQQERRCNGPCGKIKPANEFPKGRTNVCKKCKAAKAREDYAKKTGQAVVTKSTGKPKNLPKTMPPKKPKTGPSDYSVWESLYDRKLDDNEKREIRTNLTAFLTLMIEENVEQLQEGQ